MSFWRAIRQESAEQHEYSLRKELIYGTNIKNKK